MDPAFSESSVQYIYNIIFTQGPCFFREVVLFLRAVNEDIDSNLKVIKTGVAEPDPVVLSGSRSGFLNLIGFL